MESHNTVVKGDRIWSKTYFDRERTAILTDGQIVSVTYVGCAHLTIDEHDVKIR